MKLLLDTHAFVWWGLDRPQLSHHAAVAIAAEVNQVLVSTGTAWELAIKIGLGKWPGAEGVIENFEGEVAKAQFELLPITVAHVRAAGLSTSAHRDPFDRLLVAQSRIEGRGIAFGRRLGRGTRPNNFGRSSLLGLLRRPNLHFALYAIALALRGRRWSPQMRNS
ncbi:MAG: type II toxin-antitoxin system VapC family toxin [Hyphomicrobium sp.]